MTATASGVLRGLLVCAWLVDAPGLLAAPAAPGAVLEQIVAVSADRQAYRYRLLNGLTVVLTPNPGAPSVSVVHWVKAGSVHETPGRTGVAHLFEHMMFSAALARGEPSFGRRIAALGGGVAAETRSTATLYTTIGPPAQLGSILKHEAARFQRLKVTRALLDLERKVVRSEYAMKVDANPQLNLWETIYRAAFPGHPYGWTIMGERADLATLTASDCNDFFARHYRPNNTGLFVAGDFDREAALSWIVAAYGGWRAGAASELPPAYVGPQKLVRAEGALATSAPTILAGYRLPGYDGRNHHVISLAQYILFRGDFSLANRRLQTAQKVFRVASMNAEKDTGLLIVLLQPRPDVAVASVLDDLDALAGDLAALGEDEFEAYRRAFETATAEDVLANQRLNARLADGWGNHGELPALTDANAPPPVRKEDVLGFVERVLVRDNLVVVTPKGQP